MLWTISAKVQVPILIRRWCHAGSRSWPKINERPLGSDAFQSRTPGCATVLLLRCARAGTGISRQQAVLPSLLHARQSGPQARDVDDWHLHKGRLSPRRRVSITGCVTAERARETACYDR